MSDGTPLPEPDLSALLEELESIAPDASFFTVTDPEEALPPVDGDALLAELAPALAPDPAPAPPAAAAATAAPTPAAGEASSCDAEPFAFGQPRSGAPERLSVFERLTEKLGRALKEVIEPFARTRVGVSADCPSIAIYEAWRDGLPAFTSLSVYRMRPLKGGMMIALAPDFVAGLVESFYGGATGVARKPKTGDFTTSEEMLLRRLLDRVVEAVTLVWRDYAPVAPELAQRETNVGYVAFVRPEEPVVLQRFQLTCGGQPATIEIACPLAMLRPIEARLASKVHDDGDRGPSDAWRARLSGALSQVTLPVRSVLARPEISVAQLLALKPGDVIPITLPPRTPLLAGTHVIADGVIGEQEGRAAMMIDKVGCK